MGEKKRILVIDDEAMIRDMISAILTDAGYQVIVAANGAEGLEALESQAVDLIMTDILMPEKEGIETILEVRKTRPGMKIMAISGGGRVHNFDPLSIAGKIGADATLAKPFEPEQLLAAVENAIAGTRGIGPVAKRVTQ